MSNVRNLQFFLILFLIILIGGSWVFFYVSILFFTTWLILLLLSFQTFRLDEVYLSIGESRLRLLRWGGWRRRWRLLRAGTRREVHFLVNIHLLLSWMWRAAAAARRQVQSCIMKLTFGGYRGWARCHVNIRRDWFRSWGSAHGRRYSWCVHHVAERLRWRTLTSYFA